MESTLKNKSAATVWIWAIIPLIILIGLISIFLFHESACAVSSRRVAAN